ncbi:MAG: DUF922 domain-containing protein [Terriglobia bacterium]
MSCGLGEGYSRRAKHSQEGRLQAKTGFPIRWVQQMILLVLVQVISPMIGIADKSVTDGSTPLGAAPGAPAGSYKLSDFENINVFNGSLNFRLPLLQIAGRGGAQYTLTLPIETHWRVRAVPGGTGLPDIYFPDPNGWAPFRPGYSLGTMHARKASQDAISCQGIELAYTQSLTRLTFTGGDGTEFELRDQLTGGQPKDRDCSSPDNLTDRGTVFITADGSAATFISDTAINDKYPAPSPSVYTVSGNLMLRDGTRYRIDNGTVTSIRDRNGNLLQQFYDGNSRVYRIVDSLNREVLVSYRPGGQPYDEITYKGFGGASRVVRVNYANLSQRLRSDYSLPLPTASVLFPQLTGSSSSTSFDLTVVSSVQLPDGRLYQFRYNYYGELARVDLPTGGAYEYDFNGGIQGGHASGVIGATVNPLLYRRLVQRRVYDVGSVLISKTDYSKPESGDTASHPGWVGYVNSISAPVETTVQMDYRKADSTLLAREKHNFYGSAAYSLMNASASSYGYYKEGKEKQTDYYAANGTTLLRSMTTSNWQQRAVVSWWSQVSGDPEAAPPNDPRLLETVTTLSDTTQVSKQSYNYDSYNNKTDVYDYDFGTGTYGNLLRQMHTDYLQSGYDTNVNIHIRNLPVSVKTYDGTSNLRSQTDFEYDMYSGVNHAALVARPSISGLDSSYTTGYTTRGNVTRVARLKDLPSTFVYAYPQYDVAGNVVQTIDGRGYVTTFDLGDRFGSPDTEAQGNTPPAQLAGQTSYAFATSVSNPASLVTYTQYDYYTGKPVNRQDWNAVVDSVSYSDLLDRPTQVIRAANVTSPAGKYQTTFTYDDANRTITTTRDLNTYNDGLLKAQLLYDGLGRTIETRQYETSIGYITTLQTYDTLGRVEKVSNPYRPASETVQWTTTGYDALGRATSVTSPDNAAIVTTYLGNKTTVIDQASKDRRSTADALGRIIQVEEAPSFGWTYSTSYSYDALGNLVGVSQGAQPGQSRSFVYDALSQLRSATNVENGTVSYLYDENGNLTQRTDARSTVTTYIYDNLNRLTNRNYTLAGTTAATPNVTYTYATALSPCGAYSVGRLCSVSSSAATTSNTYGHPLGSITQSSQLTSSQTYTFSYGYNLAGTVTSQTYPSGKVVLANTDNAGRISNLLRQGGSYYAGDASNLIQYASHGAVQQMKLGNGLWDEARFNTRLQPTQMGLGQTVTALASSLNTTNSNRALLSFAYGSTTNNGNLQTHTIQIGSTTNLSQSFTYDAINRLFTAGEGANWSQTYCYDQYGNRWVSAGANYGNTPALTPTSPTAIDPVTNRLTGTGYDQSGNLTTDITGRTFSYDAENHQVGYNGGNVTINATYDYDGDGRRVRQFQNTVTTVFVYNAQGQMVAEYKSQGSSVPGGTSYYTTDHLGSTRVVTNPEGSIRGRHDYLPFGEELASTYGRGSIPGYGAADVRQKFTQKEHDTESGLDYFGARYFSGPQGRFTSPDKPFADQHPANPQSWNLYLYTRNNPLRYIDDDGEEVKEIVVYRTYDVHGKTSAEANANARAVSGFKSDKGEPMTGLTSGGALKVTNLVIQPSAYGFDGVFVTATETIKSADVEIKQTVTLPNWVEQFQTSPEDQAAWNTAQAGLKAHEEGHVQINREAAQKLDKALPGMVGSGDAPTSVEAYKKAGKQLTQKMNQKVRSVSTERNTRQKTYDETTDHGRKKPEGN